MTTPSGLSRAALQYWGAARGAASSRANTQDFYQALRDAATSFGEDSHGLSFGEVTQLRSSAVQVRNAAERFSRAPEENAIDARMIGVVPYGRTQDAKNALPIHQVGVNLDVADEDGNITSKYIQVRFTGNLEMTKGELLTLVQQDAEQAARDYGLEYAGHTVTEILAV